MPTALATASVSRRRPSAQPAWLAPGSFRVARDAAALDDAPARVASLIVPPPGFDPAWLSVHVDHGALQVELAVPGHRGAHVVSDEAHGADAGLGAADRARQLLALVAAEANALLPAWRA